MLFSEYLAQLPALHSWDNGKTWGTGGFDPWHLEKLNAFLSEHLPRQSTLLETGAGNSTIAFLFQNPIKVISIAPDAELFQRIRAFCQAHGISDAPLEVHIDGSQWVLPNLAAANRGSEPYLDFALIDGCHGYPTAFVDLEYINCLLRGGGWLMIDDVNLHSAKEMVRLLAEQPGYALELDLGKALVFRKTSDQRHLGEWVQQPYVARRTKENNQRGNPYALGDVNFALEATKRVKRLARRTLSRLRKTNTRRAH